MAALVLGGCVKEAPKDTGDRPVPREVDILGGPWTPSVINTTLAPGEVNWRLIVKDGCPERYSDPPFATLRVYSRTGLEDSPEYHWDPDERSGDYRVLLAGEGPWMVAGIGPPCGYWSQMALTGITEGFPADSQRNQSLWTTVEIPLTVGTGESIAEAEWAPGPYVWWLVQMYPRDEREGEQHGNISARDAHGNVTRWDHYSMFGFRHGFPAFVLVDGTYTIRLELDRPAILPTRWTYVVDYFEFSPEVCDWGFEWVGLCSSKV